MSKVRTVPSSELYRCRTCRESAGFFARKLHSRAGTSRQCEGCKKRVKGREEEGGKKGSPDGGAGASRLRPAMLAAAGIKFFERMPRVASRRVASHRVTSSSSTCFRVSASALSRKIDPQPRCRDRQLPVYYTVPENG